LMEHFFDADIAMSRTTASKGQDLSKPYFIGLGRAMVSLGPISSQRYCSYQCKFCYVQGPFPKYAAAPPEEIVKWLAARRDEYDIVYVSGDTDSFAAPRAPKALELLSRLSNLDVDVLFTTRAILSAADTETLLNIGTRQRRAGQFLIACISVSQLHHPKLEPRPIAPAADRIDFLRRLKAGGLTTALTVRPFIPSIEAGEYRAIVEMGHNAADVVLGGNLYLDEGGFIETTIAGALDQKMPSARETDQPLDFSLDDQDWRVVSHPDAEREVNGVCRELGKPFFMRSGDAIDWLRERRLHFLAR
jgi:DNA repair photolyase